MFIHTVLFNIFIINKERCFVQWSPGQQDVCWLDLCASQASLYSTFRKLPADTLKLGQRISMQDAHLMNVPRIAEEHRQMTSHANSVPHWSAHPTAVRTLRGKCPSKAVFCQNQSKHSERILQGSRFKTNHLKAKDPRVCWCCLWIWLYDMTLWM